MNVSSSAFGQAALASALPDLILGGRFFQN